MALHPIHHHPLPSSSFSFPIHTHGPQEGATVDESLRNSTKFSGRCGSKFWFLKPLPMALGMGGEERESPLSAVADGGSQPVSKEVFAAQVLLEQATRTARTWSDLSESHAPHMTALLLQVIKELHTLALMQKAAKEQKGESRNGDFAVITRSAKTRTRDVVLRREASGGLGLGFGRRNPDTGLCIMLLIPGTVAERCQQLQIGDLLIAVDQTYGPRSHNELCAMIAHAQSHRHTDASCSHRSVHALGVPEVRRLILGPPGSLVSLTITSQIKTDTVYTPRKEVPVAGTVSSLPTSHEPPACGCFPWSRRRGRAGLDGRGNREAETSTRIVQASEEAGEEVQDEEQRGSGAQVGVGRGNESQGAGGANEGDCGREEGESAYETERQRREMLFSCEFEELADWEVRGGIACVRACVRVCVCACVRACVEC